MLWAQQSSLHGSKLGPGPKADHPHWLCTAGGHTEVCSTSSELVLYDMMKISKQCFVTGNTHVYDTDQFET